MKTKILLTAFCFAAIATKAQVYFGIHAGPNRGNSIIKINGTWDKYIKPSIGYLVAADVNVPINNKLLLQTGLQFESVHNKVKTEGTTDYGGGYVVKSKFDGKATYNFLNVPIKIAYQLPVGTSKLIISAGPHLSIGIGAKSQSTDRNETTIGGVTTITVDEYSGKITYGTNDSTFKRISMGLGVAFNFKLANNLCIGAYGNKGFTNITNKNSYNITTYSFGLTLGYIFANKND